MISCAKMDVGQGTQFPSKLDKILKKMIDQVTCNILTTNHLYRPSESKYEASFVLYPALYSLFD